jgi:hypothetical protein
MATHDHPHSGHEDHGIPLLPPEARDADIPLVVWTGLGLLIFLVACVGIAKWQYEYELSLQPPLVTGPFSQQQRLPQGPKLQAYPAKDLVTFNQGQAHVSETYGWVDKQGGIARVPVDKALEMVLQKGLPVRTAENEKAALAAAGRAAAAAAAKAAAEAKK